MYHSITLSLLYNCIRSQVVLFWCENGFLLIIEYMKYSHKKNKAKKDILMETQVPLTVSCSKKTIDQWHLPTFLSGMDLELFWQVHCEE